MISIGVRYRVWVFPYQFTVDISQKACGYLWKESWVDRTDFSGLAALVTAPAYSRRMWPWVIYARFEGQRDHKAILNSHSGLSSELAAFERSLETCSRIADYLGVPVEFDEWSAETIRLHTQSKGDDPNA